MPLNINNDQKQVAKWWQLNQLMKKDFRHFPLDYTFHEENQVLLICQGEKMTFKLWYNPNIGKSCSTNYFLNPNARIWRHCANMNSPSSSCSSAALCWSDWGCALSTLYPVYRRCPSDISRLGRENTEHTSIKKQQNRESDVIVIGFITLVCSFNLL